MSSGAFSVVSPPDRHHDRRGRRCIPCRVSHDARPSFLNSAIAPGEIASEGHGVGRRCPGGSSLSAAIIWLPVKTLQPVRNPMKPWFAPLLMAFALLSDAHAQDVKRDIPYGSQDR